MLYNLSQMNERKQVTIYTDGGCDPNPGPGGYGAVLLFGAHRKELSGGFRLTTNNRMEILAVIKGLEAIKEPCQVMVYSDSKYLVDAMRQGWAKRWRERNWMRNSKDAALNPDLWERLLALCEIHQVKFAWLKGHAGISENERCDQLSTQALHQADLPADEGYENRPEDTSPGRITEEGQPCRKCGAPVVKKKPRKQPKAQQEYRMEYYLYCPQCDANYMVEEAKRPVDPTSRIF
jgi:ribonuclease HI